MNILDKFLSEYELLLRTANAWRSYTHFQKEKYKIDPYYFAATTCCMKFTDGLLYIKHQYSIEHFECSFKLSPGDLYKYQHIHCEYVSPEYEVKLINSYINFGLVSLDDKNIVLIPKKYLELLSNSTDFIEYPISNNKKWRWLDNIIKIIE